LLAVLFTVVIVGAPAPVRSEGSSRAGVPASGLDSSDAEPVSLRLVSVKGSDPAAPGAAHPPGAADSAASPTLTLHGPTRGDPSAPMALRIAPRTSTIALAVPPLDAPKGAWVQVELRSAAGKVLASGRHRQSELTGRRLLVMSSAPRPLRPGAY